MMQDTTPMLAASTRLVQPGQLKVLAGKALDAIPIDITEGFAARLIAGGWVEKIIKAGIEHERARWRREFCLFEFVTCYALTAAETGTLEERFLSMGKEPNRSTIIYEGNLVAPFSVWSRPYKPAGAMGAYIHYANTISRDVLVELLDGVENIYQGGWNFNPLQVFDFTRREAVSYDGKDYLFLLGCFKREPLLLRLWKEGNFWRLREEWWDTQAHGAENVYLVLGKRLPD